MPTDILTLFPLAQVLGLLLAFFVFLVGIVWIAKNQGKLEKESKKSRYEFFLLLVCVLIFIVSGVVGGY